MSRYTVRGSAAAGLLLLLGSLVPSVLLFALGLSAGGIGRHCAFAGGIFLAVAGTWLFLEFQAVEYTYEIGEGEQAGTCDLVIRCRRGKRIGTVCRVAVRGILLASDADKARGRKKYLCRPLFCGEKPRLFLPEEANGAYAVAIAAPEEMLRQMIRLGVSEE